MDALRTDRIRASGVQDAPTRKGKTFEPLVERRDHHRCLDRRSRDRTLTGPPISGQSKVKSPTDIVSVLPRAPGHHAVSRSRSSL